MSNRGTDVTAARPRILAFYLPQFHPIEENDDWWGEGFTEWHNVIRARPAVRGHEQPYEPADLGYYDLRVPEVRALQAELAARYGVDGFIWYHYWFGGRRLLARPFDEMLATGEPNFPFAICWANEPWTRAWDGRSQSVLMAQHYSPADDKAHGRWLARAFTDDRYIRVGGRPLLLVYRASHLPDPQRTTDTWRAEAVAAGADEPWICRIESDHMEVGDPTTLGFDASVEFAPAWAELGRPLRRTPWWIRARKLGLTERGYGRLRLFRYEDLAHRMMSRSAPQYLRYPGVTPRWDNTARRPNGGTALLGATPDRYRGWLADALGKAGELGPDAFVAVNAWNEWGEGAYLEPDGRHGSAYLEATALALGDWSPASPAPAPLASRLPRSGDP
jgi:lipopolysaccharide biosynthesis protein